MAEFFDPWLPAPGDDGKVAQSRPGILVEVFRVNATAGAGQSDPGDVAPTLLPGVACVGVEEREGSPATAVFRYRFDGRDPDSPQTAEDALSTAVTAARYPHLVEVGDRLAVRATRPDGETEWLFDGFPLTWTLALNPAAETVVMTAVSTSKRCWDTPLPGALLRDSDAPETTNDQATDFVAQFNPRGTANASPASSDSGSGSYKYPVFMDATVTGTDAGGVDYPRAWTLPTAAAYLLFTRNDQAWVRNPTRADLDGLLTAYEPIDGVPFDPSDSSTYTAKPIQAPDTPSTGRPWPAALYDLVRPSGFGMRFVLDADDGGDPRTTLDLFLRQDGAAKPLLLQPRGASFDPSLTNLGDAEIARDLSGVVNRYEVVGHQEQVEASFVLAPGFPSQQADSASASALQAFNASDPSFATSANADKYRVWVLDEDGSGHYPNNTVGSAGPTAEVTGTATSLDDVLGPPDTSTTPETHRYGFRRRPPLGRLFSLDDAGRPLKYKLHVSTDYAGTYPATWDGTGTWREVTGGFELLPDRVGIRVTEQTPNAWQIGHSSATGAAPPVLNAVDSIGNPTTGKPAFFLCLTCVIEGDNALKAVADRESTSPLAPVISRQVDARDRLFKQTIAKHSQFNNTSSPVTARDDTDLATAEAVAYRRATEAGQLGGSALIPRFTRAYSVGDRISGIDGRGLGLRTDAGGAGYAPVLPAISAIRWELEPKQQTHLEFSDAALDRRRYGITARGSRNEAAAGVARFVARLTAPGSKV